MEDRPDDPFGARSGVRTTQRRGRLSPTRRASLVELAPRWMVDPQATAGPDGPAAALPRLPDGVLVDVGGGTGAATRAWAQAHPSHAVLAVEVHRPGIAALLMDLEAEGPANLRVVEADITRLAATWPAASLAAVRVLFPDPWPKHRHRDRRLVDTAFVTLMADLLVPGGQLHLATDWPPYGDQMRSALAEEPRLEPLVHDHRTPHPLDAHGEPEVPRWRSARPDRPVTRYEQRGIDAGRPIDDLVTVRRPDRS